MSTSIITSFKFEIGSYFGGHERIEYKKDKVTHTFSDYRLDFYHHPPNVIERVIDEKELEPLNAMIPVIIGWAKYSHDSDMTDGIEWSMHISLGRKQFTRAGYCVSTPKNCIGWN